MNDLLDDLIAEGAKNLPTAKPGPGRLVVQNYAPTTFFLRHIALYYRTRCKNCNAVTLEFNGLYEESRVGNDGRHWNKMTTKPLAYVDPRKRFMNFEIPLCETCAGTADWPADEENI